MLHNHDLILSCKLGRWRRSHRHELCLAATVVAVACFAWSWGRDAVGFVVTIFAGVARWFLAATVVGIVSFVVGTTFFGIARWVVMGKCGSARWYVATTTFDVASWCLALGFLGAENPCVAAPFLWLRGWLLPKFSPQSQPCLRLRVSFWHKLWRLWSIFWEVCPFDPSLPSRNRGDHGSLRGCHPCGDGAHQRGLRAYEVCLYSCCFPLSQRPCGSASLG